MSRFNFIDTHLHSQFSPDSIMSVEEAAQAAEKLGLAGIAVTDHIDLKAPTSKYHFYFDPIEQQEEIDRVSKMNSIKIFKGVEIGLTPNNIEESITFLNSYTFDTVIAAVHYAEGSDPYHGEYYNGRERREAYWGYLELLYRMAITFKDFDILAHYDFIARYAPYQERVINYREFSDLFDSLLKFLAEEGKALEINTSTYRDREFGPTLLDREVLLRFRELGGEFISLGSDSHSVDRVGDQFLKYAAIVKECGFRYITHFEKRRAHPQRI